MHITDRFMSDSVYLLSRLGKEPTHTGKALFGCNSGLWVPLDMLQAMSLPLRSFLTGS
jgi:hypothetical protein